jgi:UPF0755 protein
MKRSRLILIFLLPTLAIICLGGIFLVNAALRLSQETEQAFGPPDPSVGRLQTFYLSTLLSRQVEDLNNPINPQGEETPFQIILGESTTTVIQRLSEQDLITDPSAFRNYLVYKGLDTGIQAGEYVLSQRMTPVEIAWALQDATPTEVSFTILAGWRIEEVAESLPTTGLEISPEGFLTTAQIMDAEGYLPSGKYQFPRDTIAEDLLHTLTEVFEDQLTQEIHDGWQNQGLTTREAVILASIIERESVVDDEMPMIASVFLNRLRANMKLDADATVQYALGYNRAQNTWWTNPLSQADLKIDSPYNTYRYKGLSPGPICNPSVEALRAVAFPAQTQYFYFRSACDGSGRHVFARTLEGHIQNECP